LTLQEAVTIVVAIVLAIAFELYRRGTLFGKLGMAIAHDPEMATAIGANTAAVAAAAFALAGAFAGVGGVLIGPITYSNPYLGDTYGIAGFVALMIGGTARPAAAMVGGLLLGVLGEAANKLINTQASDWFPFVVVVVILLALPEGLLSLVAPTRRLLQGRGGKPVEAAP
jgi:branched-chain amino acid transport system permease protein